MTTTVDDKLDALLGKLEDIAEKTEKLNARMDSADARFRQADADRSVRILREHHARSQADSADCAKFQARADAALHDFGERAPQVAAGEDPRSYRIRLARLVQNKLDPDSEMARVRLGGVGDAYEVFEGKIFADAQREAVSPSASNLPADGSLIERTVVDPMNGHKQHRFYSRGKTFIHELSSPTQQFVTAFNFDRQRDGR